MSRVLARVSITLAETIKSFESSSQENRQLSIVSMISARISKGALPSFYVHMKNYKVPGYFQYDLISSPMRLYMKLTRKLNQPASRISSDKSPICSKKGDCIIKLEERGDVRFSTDISRCTVSSETVECRPRTGVMMHVENSRPDASECAALASTPYLSKILHGCSR